MKLIECLTLQKLNHIHVLMKLKRNHQNFLLNQSDEIYKQKTKAWQNTK